MEVSNNLEIVRAKLELYKNNFSKYHNITKIQFDLLYQLTLNLKPRTILEIGTSNGYSLLSLIKGVSSFENKTTTYICSVEVNEEKYLKANDIFKELSLDSKKICVELLNENIFNINCIKCLNNKSPFDLIFIDSNQEEYSNLLNLIIKSNLISSGSSLIFDNILSHKQSYEFYKHTEFEKLGFKAKLFPIHDGFLHLLKI